MVEGLVVFGLGMAPFPLLPPSSKPLVDAAGYAATVAPAAVSPITESSSSDKAGTMTQLRELETRIWGIAAGLSRGVASQEAVVVVVVEGNGGTGEVALVVDEDEVVVFDEVVGLVVCLGFADGTGRGTETTRGSGRSSDQT